MNCRINQQVLRQRRIKLLADIIKPMLDSMTEDQVLRHARNYVAVQFFGSINTQREYAETALLIATESLESEKREIVSNEQVVSTKSQG